MNNDVPRLAVIVKHVSSFIEEIAADGGKPVCIAICDRHGFLCHFARMDLAPARCVAIARAKAYTAAVMECATSAFHARLLAGNFFCREFCDPGFTSLAGGVPIKLDNGLIAGGVGISGRKIEEDECLAIKLADSLSASPVA